MAPGLCILSGSCSLIVFALTLAGGGNTIAHKVAATRDQQCFQQRLLVDAHITHLGDFMDNGDGFRNIRSNC